jgi:hypothetical protein
LGLLYPSTIEFPGFSQTQIPLSPRDRSQSVGRGRWVAPHAIDIRRRDMHRQGGIENCEKKERERVTGCVCDVAGLGKGTRRRRQQPHPHCRLAARRVANAGQDIVGAPPTPACSSAPPATSSPMSTTYSSPPRTSAPSPPPRTSSCLPSRRATSARPPSSSALLSGGQIGAS